MWEAWRLREPNADRRHVVRVHESRDQAVRDGDQRPPELLTPPERDSLDRLRKPSACSLLHHAPQHVEEQVFLARVVGVERLLGLPRLRSDHVRASPRESSLQEDPACPLAYLLALRQRPGRQVRFHQPLLRSLIKLYSTV